MSIDQLDSWCHLDSEDAWKQRLHASPPSYFHWFGWFGQSRLPNLKLEKFIYSDLMPVRTRLDVHHCSDSHVHHGLCVNAQNLLQQPVCNVSFYNLFLPLKRLKFESKQLQPKTFSGQDNQVQTLFTFSFWKAAIAFKLDTYCTYHIILYYKAITGERSNW